MDDYFDLDDNINKAGYFVAVSRYREEYGAWVGYSQTRLDYLVTTGALQQVAKGAARDTGAQLSYVESRLQAFADDAVAVTEPEHVDLESGQGDSLPPEKFLNTDNPLEGDVVRSDVLDHGAVLDEEAYEPDARIDVNDYTVSVSCFRCGGESKTASVCEACTDELVKIAIPGDGMGISPPLKPVDDQYAAPSNPDDVEKWQCKFCQKNGQVFEGNAQMLQQHLNTMHQADMQTQNQQMALAAQQYEGDCAVCGRSDDVIWDETAGEPRCHRHRTRKVAQLPGAEPLPEGPPAAPAGDTSGTAPAPNENKVEVGEEETPADNFDSIVQDVANRAAAKHFSIADDEMISQIAEQNGVDEMEVKNSLYVEATFGDYSAANGGVGDVVGVPEDYVEVKGIGGPVDSHEALVPIDLVLGKVAETQQISEELAYQQVKDKYGADLPDKYHASVNGEQRFYLPGSMVGPQDTPAPEEQAPPVPGERIQ